MRTCVHIKRMATNIYVHSVLSVTAVTCSGERKGACMCMCFAQVRSEGIWRNCEEVRAMKSVPHLFSQMAEEGEEESSGMREHLAGFCTFRRAQAVEASRSLFSVFFTVPYNTSITDKAGSAFLRQITHHSCHASMPENPIE